MLMPARKPTRANVLPSKRYAKPSPSTRARTFMDAGGGAKVAVASGAGVAGNSGGKRKSGVYGGPVEALPVERVATPTAGALSLVLTARRPSRAVPCVEDRAKAGGGTARATCAAARGREWSVGRGPPPPLARDHVCATVRVRSPAAVQASAGSSTSESQRRRWPTRCPRGERRLRPRTAAWAVRMVTRTHISARTHALARRRQRLFCCARKQGGGAAGRGLPRQCSAKIKKASSRHSRAASQRSCRYARAAASCAPGPATRASSGRGGGGGTARPAAGGLGGTGGGGRVQGLCAVVVG